MAAHRPKPKNGERAWGGLCQSLQGKSSPKKNTSNIVEALQTLVSCVGPCKWFVVWHMLRPLLTSFGSCTFEMSLYVLAGLSWARQGFPIVFSVLRREAPEAVESPVAKAGRNISR